MTVVTPPFKHFTEADGGPLENGYIYIGEQGLNPETNPVAVYWDSDFVTPAAQPLRTSGGYIVRNGTAASVHVNAASYSITVRDRNSVLVHSTLSEDQAEGGVDPGIDYQTSSPFGVAGLRIIAGEEEGPFYGFCGIAKFASGKWVLIYRKATKHGIEDNAELRAKDSYDKGNTWVNDRLLYQNALSDARPDAPAIMANNRMGFFVNRQDEGSTHFSPLFFKSDDEGVTFSNETITTSSPYTFQASGGIIRFPASQGGHDTLGFISFGYLSATGVDAFTTVNNGDAWSIVNEVAVGDGVLIQAGAGISENVNIRVGTQDKWLMFCRSKDTSGAWNANLMVYATSNLLSWGAPTDAGIGQDGNPPAALYDPATNMIHYLLIPRAGREIPGYPADCILIASADADDLYDADGDFASLGVSYKVYCRTPNWTTGYLVPFLDDGKWYATFTGGESGASESLAVPSMIMLLGDFVPSGADASVYIRMMMRRQYSIRNIDIKADNNVVTDYSLKISNASRTASASFGAYAMSVNTGYVFRGGTVAAPYDFRAADNVTTTYPVKISNSAESASASFGAYGCSFSAGYVVDIPSGQSLSVQGAGNGAIVKAKDNVTTTYPLVIKNNAESASASFGAYGASFSGSYTVVGDVTLNGHLTLSAKNLITDTTTGTKIGTGATQKIGFWNATPVVQQAAVADAAGGATVDAEARTALNSLLAKLRTMGIIAT